MESMVSKRSASFFTPREGWLPSFLCLFFVPIEVFVFITRKANWPYFSSKTLLDLVLVQSLGRTRVNEQYRIYHDLDRRKKILMGIVESVVLVLLLSAGGAAARIFNVVDFGAAGDAKTDDKQAFLKTWAAACLAADAPTMLVPRGKVFLLSPIFFGGPCASTNIHFRVNGTIIAPNQIWTDQPINWIQFSNVDYLTIDGSGVFDGMGEVWLDCRSNNKCNNHPNLFGVTLCKSVRLADLLMVNSPGRHLTLSGNEFVVIDGLVITSSANSPSDQGVLIQETQHVQVNNVKIATGDDCLAIGTGTLDVNVSGSVFSNGNGISIGNLGGGSTAASVEQVHVTDCSFLSTKNGVTIKTSPGGSGYAKGISFENLNFTSVNLPIVIDQYDCPNSNCQTDSGSDVEVSDVLVSNAHGTTRGELGIKLACSGSVPCTGIRLQDVTIQSASDPSAPVATYCLGATGDSIGQVIPSVSCLSSSSL